MRPGWDGVALATSLACLAFHAGCTAEGEPAAPRILPAGAIEPPPAPVFPDPVGPAPLRRLSNEEYLNALHDLFPAVHVTLPTLPRDVPVAGFENAADAQEPSDVRVSRYEEIARSYAAAVVSAHGAVPELSGCAGGVTRESAEPCGRTFLARTGRRLFRRPLEPGETERLLASFRSWCATVGIEGALELTLTALLQSPQFLYRPEPLPASASPEVLRPVERYAMASRLSFLLWASAPDDELLDAAGREELHTEEGVRRQATRMLDHPRARRVFWTFHRQWLGLDRILQEEHLVRTPEVDAQWTPATPTAAAEESRRFVEGVLGSGGTFQDLFTSRRAWVNAEMARLYGLGAPTEGGWTETELPDGQRAGLLTRAAFLAGFAHRGGTSPPVRGNGVQLRLLCQLPIAPPAGVDLSQPAPAKDQGPATTRMLFEARTAPERCQQCHVGLNGFGFGFEAYDAAGRFRTHERELQVNAQGTIVGTDVDGPFDGALELSRTLARSRTVHACATGQWLRFALGRAPVEVEAPTVAKLTASFARSGDVRALLLDIVSAPAFRLRRGEAP